MSGINLKCPECGALGIGHDDCGIYIFPCCSECWIKKRKKVTMIEDKGIS